MKGPGFVPGRPTGSLARKPSRTMSTFSAEDGGRRLRETPGPPGEMQQSSNSTASSEWDPPPAPADSDGRGSSRDPDAEAMLRRIAGRLLGERPEAVRIGRFRVLETLGEGGMGVVYAAEDAKLDRRVAIKTIRGDILRGQPGERARLLREARALARLSHPNVVQVYEVGETASGVFVVMELVRGTTLREWLEAPRPLDAILGCFLEAGRGLDAAHRAGIVHRDFKPSNALVGADGRVRIVDFGLARPDCTPEDATSPPVTREDRRGERTLPAGAQGGTPAYMSPEQILGVSCDARSDQFSFCVALYEALYRKLPFAPGELAARLRDPDLHAARELPAGPAPRWLREVLTRGLAVRPEDRYPSMTALLATLEGTPRRRRRAFGAAVGALVVAGAVTTGVALTSSPPSSSVRARRIASTMSGPSRNEPRSSGRSPGRGSAMP